MPKGQAALRERPRRGRKIALFGCILAPAFLCGIGSIFVGTYVSKHADRLPDELAGLRKLGVPTEPEHLLRQTPLADEKNAAQIYSSVVYQLNGLQEAGTHKETFKLLDTFGSSKDNAELPKVLAALRSYNAIFSDADKLSKRPEMEFRRDYTKGFKLLFPEYVHIKRLSRWLCSRAKAQWLTGERDEALSSLRTAYLISGQLSKEPTLIGQLVCISVYGIAHRTMTGLLTDSQGDPRALEKIRALLESTGQVKSDLFLAFGGEVVMGRYTLQNLGSLSELTDPNGKKGRDWMDHLLSAGGVKRMYEAELCEAWRKIFERMPKDRSNWAQVREAVVSTSREIEADRSPENILNRILFPVFDGACDAAGKQIAERRLGLLSVKLLQLRSKALPEDLSSFGEIAVDPFTRKSMHYEKKGAAFKVWSVGADGVDNGGVARKPGQGSGNKGTDIVMGFGIEIPEVVPSGPSE